MHSEQIKELIQLSAGDAGQGDASWEATGVDRLYFHDPLDPETSGAIDVQRTEGQIHTERVKLELWITPLKAAEIIALVTGAKPTALEAIARKLQPEIARVKALPIVALGYTPTNDVVAPPAPPAIREHESAPRKTAIEIADEKRRIELKQLVKEQEEEERREAEQEAREEREGQPEEIAI